MTRNLTIVFLCALVAAVIVDDTMAQQGRRRASSRLQSPQNRPTTSPYLNLLGGNRGPGFNYYRRVRPEQNFLRNDAIFNRSLGNMQQEMSSFKRQLQSTKSGLSPTGHRTSFLNLGNYFGSNSRR